jgi:hypothetical protein
MIHYGAYLALAASLLAAAPPLHGESASGVSVNAGMADAMPIDSRAATPYTQSRSDQESYAGDQSGVGQGVPAPGAKNDTAPSSGEHLENGPARALVLILTASGVPHQNGQIAWPAVLRVLHADAQMQRLEAQLQLAAEQVIGGGVNPNLLKEIRSSVEGLRRLVQEDKATRWPSLPAELYDDAERFLQGLGRTPRIAEAAAPVRRY